MINGSYGEGGGQLVRSAVALSVVFNKPISLINIRSGRERSGLKAQHLYAIKALKELTNARVSGLELGSSELIFEPSDWSLDEVTINIPTAGSIGLVIQCLLPALITAPNSIKVNFIGGATCGAWSPSLDFMINVLFPNLKAWGVKTPLITVEREGYYPRGGAIVTAQFTPSSVTPASIIERGSVLRVNGLSHASESLRGKRVAERQAEAVKINYPADIKSTYSESLCPGSSLTLWAECEHSRLGADSLGERGKTSEMVAKEAVNKLLKELESGAFDSHTTDMLIPFMAIAGSGSITTSEVTSHALTNAWLCEQFTGKKFTIKNNKITYGKL